MDKEQQGIADARLICEELHGELPEGEQYGSVEIAMILSRRVRELEAIASPVARSNKLQDLIAHIEGALINSEGKDFNVSADFVRDELIPSLASLSAEPERIAQLIAHRACCSGEHDPASGKLHGCCVVCGVPWPCEYAGKPPAPPEREGFVSVPREPTYEQEAAGGVVLWEKQFEGTPWRNKVKLIDPASMGEYNEVARHVYEAMLASQNAQEKSDERRSGHSALHGRPLDDDGGAELRIVDHHPAESAPPDIATAYTQAAQDALTWCGAAEPIWRTSTAAETLAIDISAASSVDLCFGQTGRPLTEEERALIVGALNAITPLEGK